MVAHRLVGRIDSYHHNYKDFLLPHSLYNTHKDMVRLLGLVQKHIHYFHSKTFDKDQAKDHHIQHHQKLD